MRGCDYAKAMEGIAGMGLSIVAGQDAMAGRIHLMAAATGRLAAVGRFLCHVTFIGRPVEPSSTRRAG